jgi:hypothetical protein
MENKIKIPKIWLRILVILMFFINGCASISTANSNTWIEHEIPPSQVKFTGEIFMQIKLSDSSICSVFQDDDLISDAYFYESILMQDFGWRKSGDNWAGNGYSRDYKLGCMYINPRRQVAIYFDPQDEFSIFRASVKNASN